MKQPTSNQSLKSPFDKLVNSLMVGLTQSALWSLRRVDYLFNGSVIKLNNPNHYDNPYVTYSALRGRGRILRSVANRGWIITGFNEISELLRDPRISTDIRKNRFLMKLLSFAAAGIDVPILDNPTMLNQDPPDHTRLRKLVATGFMHKYIQSLAPKIEQLVDDLLASIPEHAENIDLIKQLAKPLPAIVIAEMLGVPVDKRHQFEQWSESLLGLTELSNPSAIHLAATANEEMRTYIAELTEQKRQQPGQDLISLLIAAEENGDKLTLSELYSTCVLLLIAGHETTTRLIGNCMYLLTTHPNQMASVENKLAVGDDTVLMRAIEETLRYEPPVQLTVRFVHEDMVFHGKKFKRGQMLLLSIAGANRDPLANENPDVFDITREKNNHLSFGHGIHLCLGMSLARLETKIVITKILQRFPILDLQCNEPSTTEKPQWGRNDFFRGLEQFSITINPKK